MLQGLTMNGAELPPRLTFRTEQLFRLFRGARVALLLGDGVLQCVTFLFHLVATVGARASRDQVPATGERRKQRKECGQTNDFRDFHGSFSQAENNELSQKVTFRNRSCHPGIIKSR